MINLIGLKENVIIGKKIPAGTGLIHSEETLVGSKEEYERTIINEELEINEDILEEIQNTVKKQ